MKQKNSKTTKKQQKLQDDNFIMNLTFDDRMKDYTDNMLNGLGYLEFITSQFPDYRKEHDGWFYAGQKHILAETQMSLSTWKRCVRKYIADGLIEYRQGDWNKANGIRPSEFKLKWDFKEVDIYGGQSTGVNQGGQTSQLVDIQRGSTYNNTGVKMNENDEVTPKNKEVRNKNKEVRIKSMKSCIIDSSIDVTREKNQQDLNCFVLRFLDCSSRAEGIEVYTDFTKTHKLQDDEMEFLASYTSKVGEIKGWKQTTTNNASSEETEELNGNVNTSSTEEETRFTTTANTSSFKTPSELDFLADFDEEVEEVTHTENNAKTSVSSSEEKKYTVDWSVNLNTAKSYFKQTAYRYAKQWMNLSDEEREKRFVSVVESGFPEDTFAPFERYIKGITLEKATEFADIVNEEARKYQVALQNGNSTPSNEDDAEYFSDVVDNYATEKEKLNEQMEQTSAYIYNLLGW